MRDLARELCDRLLGTYGDFAFVTPEAFAHTLRATAQIPDNASPLHTEQWMRRYVTVRIDAAHPDVPGMNYTVGDMTVIETGRGRSREERNVTIVHEFGECVGRAIMAELAARGLPALAWSERDWDHMAVEFVEPRAAFRERARDSGLSIIELAKPLSFEAVVHRLKAVFEDDLPLFAVYYRNDGWRRGSVGPGDAWKVAATAWTKPWLRYSYRGRRETLRVPRKAQPIRPGSIVDAVRNSRSALLVHTRDVIDGSTIEADALVRTRCYGRDVAQVFVIGVERRYGEKLLPQIQLVAPGERDATFTDLF